ncbi:MAG: MoaD/ThiS family protein, partial [Candidatus Aenigmarchaeota archaeon]|nr:MoaD/ThiS family protein [Candidatus Aenigmarchaeota archaeon]
MLLKIGGHAREIASDELTFSHIRTTIIDIINEIEKKHNGFKDEILKNDYLILKNGTNIGELNKLDTLVKNNDVIQILPKI